VLMNLMLWVNNIRISLLLPYAVITQCNINKLNNEQMKTKVTRCFGVSRLFVKIKIKHTML